jgi:long-chain acyl-CoA synthetase
MGNIISMVQKSALRYGEREVFRYRKADEPNYTSISWINLVDDYESVSRALISMELGVGENIGIFSENRPEWVISDLGIMSARSVSVPFYATSSKQQLKYIVDETKMKLIFVGNQEQYEKAIWLLENTHSLKKIVVFDENVSVDNYSSINWNSFLRSDSEKKFDSESKKRVSGIKEEDIATIIYTSGTTGESKGAILSHSRFMHAFKIHDERLEVNAADVSVCFLPLSHVFERTWTYYIMHCGSTNAFISNPREIVKQMPVIKPTLMCTVPRFFEKTYEGIQLEFSKWPSVKQSIFNWSIKIGHEYSECLSKSNKPGTALKLKRMLADIFGGKIRYMPCAGAAISPFLLRFFHAAGLFINYGYGATETTATVSCFKTDRYDFDSCGTIMPGVQVKISSEGEILIKGETVFDGYYNKPEETKRTIVDGWYQSGDQGYITENGDLVMTDRIKDLIKTSVGKYVSPQKIELLFGQDPYIEQVIAIGDNRKYITALIVPSFETLRSEVSKMGLHDLNNIELVDRQEVVEFFKNRIDKLQEEFTPYEKVVRFKLLPEPFSIQNGMLTNTLKVRRSLLIEQFREDIEKMYLP